MTCMHTRPSTATSSTACWCPRPSSTAPGAGAGKYTLAQRNRLYRVGVRQFFRLDRAPGPPIQTMGDCGAFSYVQEDVPPYTPDQVIDFYAECGFDLGISVDHVIFGYDPAADTDPQHPQGETVALPPADHAGPGRRVPGQVHGQEGPLRTARRGAGMEPGLLRGGSPQPAEDRLHAHRPRRHGSPQDRRNTRLPQGKSPRRATPALNSTCWASPGAATSPSSPPSG